MGPHSSTQTDSLKGDREIVLAAVQQNGPSLEYADRQPEG